MRISPTHRQFTAASLVLIAGCLLSFSGNVSADETEPEEFVTSAFIDPTRPNWFENPKKTKKAPRLALNSLVNGPQRRIAVISGELMREGDSHRGFTLEQILEDRVIMNNQSSGRLVLKLATNNPPAKTPRGTQR